MAAASVRAQAKINLLLRVTGREASGYHTLETLFCRIALADVISVRLTRSSRSLDCYGPELPRRGLGTVAENLAWRAAVAYADAARWPAGFEIELEKNIPVGAGLGGGSADAGGVLRTLNALNPRPMSGDALQGIAGALGADVPFLTQQQAVLALASGRGDVLCELPSLPERTCILAIPSLGVRTQEAYAWIDQERGWTDREVVPQVAGEVPQFETWEDVAQHAHNDFEQVVFPRYPEIAAAWRYLGDILGETDRRGFARLSGSGGATYAVARRGPAAAREHVPNGIRTIITQTAPRVEPVQRID